MKIMNFEQWVVSVFEFGEVRGFEFFSNMGYFEQFVSLLDPSISVDIEILRDCYESFAMYCFGRYLVACLGMFLTKSILCAMKGSYMKFG